MISGPWILLFASIVWTVSYLRLPKMTFPQQINVVQRFNFATINSVLVILVYLLLELT